MKKVHIIGSKPAYVKMFEQRGFKQVALSGSPDLVVFTGGPDVGPELYGQPQHKYTSTHGYRDQIECGIYSHCLNNDIPMVGICRGGQLLNVLNDGSLYQHVEGHGDCHYARDVEGNSIKVTSTHHQMMIPADEGAEVFLWVDRVTGMNDYLRETWDGEKFSDPYAKYLHDIEGVYYKDTKCMCFQPHPEYRHSTKECTDFFFSKLGEFIFQ